MRGAVLALILALILALSVTLGSVGAAPPVQAAPNQIAVNVDAEGNAIRGYDTVAYFTEGKAVRGLAAYSITWKGARWLFASASNREQFAADPERYAPRVGGFCALGASRGRMVEVDPQMWLMVRGRLYLYANESVRRAAAEDAERSTAEAEVQWEKLQAAATK